MRGRPLGRGHRIGDRLLLPLLFGLASLGGGFALLEPFGHPLGGFSARDRRRILRREQHQPQHVLAWELAAWTTALVRPVTTADAHLIHGRADALAPNRGAALAHALPGPR